MIHSDLNDLIHCPKFWGFIIRLIFVKHINVFDLQNLLNMMCLIFQQRPFLGPMNSFPSQGPKSSTMTIINTSPIMRTRYIRKKGNPLKIK